MTKRKNKHAVALGKRGGKRSQANKTPEQRSESCRKAALARHAKRRGEITVTRDVLTTSEGKALVTVTHKMPGNLIVLHP